MSKDIDSQSHERPEHLEQIRDIIFGPNKREFETRFQHLDAQLADMKSQFTQMVEALNSTLSLELRSAVQSLENKIKIAAENSGDDRDAITKQIDQMETRFDKSLQHTIQTAAEKITALDLTMKSETGKLQQELVHLKEQLYHDLETRANELTDSKVSREMMAEALIELGMKVKTGERMAELKLITQKKPNQ